jgi:MoaA/NifB/PqqE/SkfB family radical SAM enzyme
MSIKELIGIALTALESNFTTLGKPYKLNYAITYRCNSRCLTCNIWKHYPEPKEELSLDEVREFAKKNRSFRWLTLTGGEPFLRNDIVDIVRAFKDNSVGLYLLTIPTNSLCSPDKIAAQIEEMIKMGIPRIVITLSLDGNRELHDSVRGIKGNYDRAIALFKRLSELHKAHPGFSVMFGYTISRINQGHLEETYQSVKQEIPWITHNDFHINLAQQSDNYYNNSGENILADRKIAMDELSGAFKEMKINSPMSMVEHAFIKGLISFAKTGKAPMRCRSLDASLFLDSNGSVYPSIMWNRKIANIHDTGYDLSGIWRGAEAAEIRRLIREGKEPVNWTSCEAYQAILGNMPSMLVP